MNNPDDGAYNFLIIEDNLGDYTLIEELIKEQFNNYTLEHKKKFKDASEVLKASPAFDAILLDLSLPDKSGENLVVSILKLALDTPVIVLTGYSEKSFALTSLSLGAADYLFKDELTAIILYRSIVYSIKRKKDLEALAESEKKYSNMFQLSPQPIWVFDALTLKILDVNDAAIVNYGYDKDTFLRMTIKDLRHAEDFAEVEDALLKLTEDKSKHYHGILRHKKKDGTIKEVEVYSNAINYQNKNAYVVLANDVTEKNKYIKAIEEQNKKLREIAWIQSHVVRAPLAKLMGFIDVFKNFNTPESEKQLLLNYIVSSAHELDVLIRDIADKTQFIE